jgi:hypothetical protein
LPEPHAKQKAIIESRAKRKIVRAGRRGGKTIVAAIIAVLAFVAQRRVLYAAPTSEQIDRFWTTVTRAFYEAIKRHVYYKNETEHLIELRRTEQRIRAKTAWNADTLRGDYADVLILDEWQLMNEDAWAKVGAPMLLDNNGDAIFIYTPPSLHSRLKNVQTKAKDPQHASKMFKKAQEEMKAGGSRWEAFHFRSQDNPHISEEALEDIVQDMTSLDYRMEILAEDIDQAPGALWKRDNIEDGRLTSYPDLARVVVGVDPSATSTGDEAGIIVAGSSGKEGYVLGDLSIQGSPLSWAQAAVAAYHKFKADRIIAEANNGGEMVELTIRQVDAGVPVKLVHASRGKHTRAEPVAAIYEQGRIHHIGRFDSLEDEMCLWVPGDASPNRMDALVWAFTELKISTATGMLDFLAAQQKEENERRQKNEKGSLHFGT